MLWQHLILLTHWEYTVLRDGPPDIPRSRDGVFSNLLLERGPDEVDVAEEVGQLDLWVLLDDAVEDELLEERLCRAVGRQVLVLLLLALLARLLLALLALLADLALLALVPFSGL